ncbi:MAG TPA: exonuclease domain-containing protein [bacterium]|nr:exonuclease domain-containing protein [bacterium]HPS31081.1 exonuclease domain-containing protein [bacterium]
MHNVTVVDFETTGLYADSGDRITEIGAIKLRGNKITGVFNSLINPEREIPELAVSITGITNEMVASAPTIAQALPTFVEFLQDDVLVMHNAAFDGSFLKYEMKHLGLKKEYEYFCTLKAARKEVKSSNFKLATLKNILNLRTFGTMHRALSDTYVTAQLFLKLEKNFGIDTISVMEKDIQRLLNEMESDDLFVMENN